MCLYTDILIYVYLYIYIWVNEFKIYVLTQKQAKNIVNLKRNILKKKECPTSFKTTSKKKKKLKGNYNKMQFLIYQIGKVFPCFYCLIIVLGVVQECRHMDTLYPGW